MVFYAFVVEPARIGAATHHRGAVVADACELHHDRDPQGRLPVRVLELERVETVTVELKLARSGAHRTPRGRLGR